MQPQMKGLLGAPVAIIRAPCRVVLPQPRVSSGLSASPASASCSRPEASWSRGYCVKKSSGQESAAVAPCPEGALCSGPCASCLCAKPGA